MCFGDGVWWELLWFVERAASRRMPLSEEPESSCGAEPCGSVRGGEHEEQGCPMSGGYDELRLRPGTLSWWECTHWEGVYEGEDELWGDLTREQHHLLEHMLGGAQRRRWF